MLETLQELDIKAYLARNHVSVYAIKELKKYFFAVGSSNPKHIAKFRTYMVRRFGEVSERPNEAAC